MDYKKIIAQNLQIEGVTQDEIYSNIGVPQDPALGDLSLPCFKYSRLLRLSPVQIAQNLKAQIESRPEFESVEAVAGYLNFRLKRVQVITDALNGILSLGEDFKKENKNGKTVCIDYSSVNIAKPFHIGHLLTTAIGGSLYRIFEFLGYNVVGINHLGDWGTQFGELISAYKKWGNDTDIEKNGIHALLELYVRFNKEAEAAPELMDEARAWFKKIEDGDAEALAIFTKFKEITLKEVNQVYDLLGIKFDSYNGESFYNDKLSDVVSKLEQKGLLIESKGAKIVDLEKYGMAPCLILKSDGSSLYATRDLAAAIYRKQTYNFDKCLYVVAYQQNLHFSQVFKTLELMEYDWAKDCVHVQFGMVSLENIGAMSTRKGKVVFLKDVFNTSVQKALEIINAKSPELQNKEKAAKEIGIGAVVFGALNSSRIKDLVFSYDKALNFDGETAPYLQYTHARCCSILSKSESAAGEINYGGLTDEESYAVVRHLSKFNETVSAAAEKYEPSILARYLVDLAQSFNKFYIANKVLGNSARESLTNCVRLVLKNGLRLLLINAPEKM